MVINCVEGTDEKLWWTIVVSSRIFSSKANL